MYMCSGLECHRRRKNIFLFKDQLSVNFNITKIAITVGIKNCHKQKKELYRELFQLKDRKHE